MRRLAVSLVALTAIACSGEPLSTGPAPPDLPSLSADRAASASGYKAIDLGTLGGNTSSTTAINDLGQVVGESRTATGELHAFLWQDGVMTDLGTLGGNTSGANAINNLGQVVGTSRTASGAFHGFLWENGVMTDLGGRTAFAINEQTQVVGKHVIAGCDRSFVWQSGVTTDLGTLGGCVARAVAINNVGQVVGLSSTASGEAHAFLWEDGVMTDLGSLGGSSGASDIDLNGQVVGSSKVAVGTLEQRPFLWDQGVGMTDLGSFGGVSGGAHAINDAGQVAGWSDLRSGEQRGFLWAGTMTTLEPLGGFDQSYANLLNNKGHVAGYSWVVGESRATLWRSLVPEELHDLIGLVESLFSEGAFSQGQYNSLLNKLNIATAMLNDGKVGPAVNHIGAFIYQVEALMSGNNPVLTPEQGQPLIDLAQEVIASLGG